MKNSRDFTLKFFEIKLKNNWKLRNFLEHFEMEETAFWGKLQAMFSSKSYNDIVRKIQRNEKRNETIITNASETDEEVEPQEEETTVEDIVAMIEQAKAEKSAVQVEKEKYLKRRQETLQKVEGTRKILEDIKREIREQEAVLQSCIDRVSNIEKKLASCADKERELDEKIEMLLEEKKELEKIVIKVSEGQIESAIPVPDTWKDAYNYITSLEEATDEESAKLLEIVEMMNLKALRVLAKLFAIANVVEKEGKTCYFLFDEESDISIAMEMLELFEIEIKAKE